MPHIYEVAHLACTPSQLTAGFKFIVTQTKTGPDRYKFYADASERLHLHIREKMVTLGKLGEDERVIGGGWIHRESIDGTRSVLVLDAESNRFGQEPREVREALRPFVIEALLNMGIQVE